MPADPIAMAMISAVASQRQLVEIESALGEQRAQQHGLQPEDEQPDRPDPQCRCSCRRVGLPTSQSALSSVPVTLTPCSALSARPKT